MTVQGYAAESTLVTVKQGRLVGSEHSQYSGGVIRAVDIRDCAVGNPERVVGLNSHLGDGHGKLVCNSRCGVTEISSTHHCWQGSRDPAN